MTSALRHQGSNAARVTNRKLTITETAATATVTVRGGLSLVQATISGTYAVGQKIDVLGESDLEITQLDLETEEGGIGRLTVTASKGRTTTQEGEGGTPATESNYHVEMDFTTVTKPLSEHPEYGDQIDDWDAIRRWESLKGEAIYAGRYAAFDTPTETAAKKEDGPDPAIDADWEALTGRSKSYAEHVARGVTEYMVQVPVVRKTTRERFNENDTLSKAGKKVSYNDVPKPFRSIADAWLKTADRWSRDSKSGIWNHYEEWSGFDELDEVLYGAGYTGDDGGDGGDGGEGGGEGGGGGDGE